MWLESLLHFSIPTLNVSIFSQLSWWHKSQPWAPSFRKLPNTLDKCHWLEQCVGDYRCCSYTYLGVTFTGPRFSLQKAACAQLSHGYATLGALKRQCAHLQFQEPQEITSKSALLSRRICCSMESPSISRSNTTSYNAHFRWEGEWIFCGYLFTLDAEPGQIRSYCAASSWKSISKQIMQEFKQPNMWETSSCRWCR